MACAAGGRSEADVSASQFLRAAPIAALCLGLHCFVVRMALSRGRSSFYIAAGIPHWLLGQRAEVTGMPGTLDLLEAVCADYVYVCQDIPGLARHRARLITVNHITSLGDAPCFMSMPNRNQRLSPPIFHVAARPSRDRVSPKCQSADHRSPSATARTRPTGGACRVRGARRAGGQEHLDRPGGRSAAQ